METKKTIQLKDTHQNIIKQYKITHRIVFTYALFAIIAIIGFVVGLQITGTQKDDFHIQDREFANQEKKLIDNFENILDQEIQNPDVEIFLLQGTLEDNENITKSYNNILSYKGYIVPQHFLIYKNSPVPPKTYFATTGYDTQKLGELISSIVFSKNRQVEKVENQITQLPLTTDLIDVFNLECLFQTKVFGSVCKHFTYDFINNFWVYNLSNQYTQLKNVFDKIKNNTQQKQLFCSNISKYALYSNDTSSHIESIFYECGKQAIQQFDLIQGFKEIEEQLEVGYINKKIYNNTMLNVYKLLSIQQLIYNDFSSNTLNTKRIDTYIPFTQELLKKEALDPFYIDELYWFNNAYLQKRLENPIYASSNQEDDINMILDQLYTINKGSILIGFAGLNEQITNPLLLGINEVDLPTENQTTEIDLETLVDSIKQFSFFTLSKSKIKEQYIYIEGFFSIIIDERKNLKKDISTQIILNTDQSILTVKSIQIPEYKELTEVINSLIQQQNMTLPQIYQYINDNIALYLTKPQEVEAFPFCGLLKTSIEEARLTSCNSGKVVLTKRIDRDRFTYTISLNNYKITNVSVDNQQLQSEIHKQLLNIETNKFNVVDTIVNIGLYQLPNSQQEGSDNALLITQRFEKYFNQKLINISEKEGEFLIEFNIKGIRFVGFYNILQHVLGPIYFKNVTIAKKPIMIRNFSLPLSDDNITEINTFKTDPLFYINEINPAAYEAYQEYK